MEGCKAGANAEMKRWREDWDEKTLIGYGASRGIDWKFVTADAQFQNGVAESMIKAVKHAISAAIGDTVFTYHEILTVVMEAANLVN